METETRNTETGCRLLRPRFIHDIIVKVHGQTCRHPYKIIAYISIQRYFATRRAPTL